MYLCSIYLGPKATFGTPYFQAQEKKKKDSRHMDPQRGQPSSSKPSTGLVPAHQLRNPAVHPHPPPRIIPNTVNSRKLEHGLRMTRAGIHFSIPFGDMGIRMYQLFGCSNFLEFTVGWYRVFPEPKSLVQTTGFRLGAFTLRVQSLWHRA